MLDDLNRQLRLSGLWFPVDVSTASRATIGGMAGNNSCGTRSIRYGIMRDNVLAIDALLADGTEARFAEVSHNLSTCATDPLPARGRKGWRRGAIATRKPLSLFRDMLALGRREAEHIAHAFPEVSRRVGGYLIDALVPGSQPVNLATLLCGSEGTLAISRRLELKLSPIPRNKALGICHFASFRKAMEATQHIVKLGPVAVEVVDRTLIELARDIAMFRPVMESYVRGAPDALLLVEFAEDNQAENLRRLDRLEELMGDLGHPKSVVKVADAAGQRAVWEVRASGLNIMMSMKAERKPVSFIEDCAVPLEHLADYTERLTAIFEKHGTKGTWYAHASVGCLHVRPVLNLKLEKDANTMRAIAEEAFALVKAYKGSHSGEHGDGLVRSEFHEKMYGAKTVRLFEEVKDRFDPTGLMNPGKIVRGSRMNDRTLFRFKPDYRVPEMAMALDWSAYPGRRRRVPGRGGDVQQQRRMPQAGRRRHVPLLPRYRQRGRRDARPRQLPPSRHLRPAGPRRAGLRGDAGDHEAVRLLQGLPARVPHRRRHGQDEDRGAGGRQQAARALAARSARGLPAALCAVRVASGAAHERPQCGPRSCLADRTPHRHVGQPHPPPLAPRCVSTFPLSPFFTGRGDARGRAIRRYVQHLLRARELARGGRGAHPPRLSRRGARRRARGWRYGSPGVERRRDPSAAGARSSPQAWSRKPVSRRGALLAAAAPFLARGAAIVGLEPSCLLTLRDEFLSMLPGAETERLARHAFLLEEFLEREAAAGHIAGPIGRQDGKVLLHGHCHQKAFGAMGSVGSALALVEGLEVETVELSCCGMAGAFGYGAETHAVSMAMGELTLLPAVRRAAPDAVIAADGFSCRHQIRDGTGRQPRHVARILRDAMSGTTTRKSS